MKLDNSYFQPTLDNLFEEYQKGMSDLAIDDSERLLIERDTIQAERTQLEVEIQHNKDLESRMAEYEKNQLRKKESRPRDNNNDLEELENKISEIQNTKMPKKRMNPILIIVIMSLWVSVGFFLLLFTGIGALFENYLDSLLSFL